MDQEKLMLLVDCCYGSEFTLELSESVASHGLTKFRGKFQEAEAVNKNKRLYPRDVLDENIGRLKESITERRLVGELDHPTDSIIHFANASHVVTKLWWEGNALMGEGEILNTPHGKVLKALLEDNVKVGISSRGVGSGRVNEDGILVIGESYKLITFDCVADPSTFAAFQEKVVSKPKKENVDHSRDERIGDITPKIAIKNESSGIHTVNKEALIACLGGFVKFQTQKFQSRLQ